jgi:Protein of unknown function (DUF3619)
MKNKTNLSENLPAPIQGYVETLRQSNPALSPEVERGLLVGRAAALKHAQARANRASLLSGRVGVLVYAHPGIAGVLVFAMLLSLLLMFTAAMQNDEDALLLGDDMPIEAFVDNGFDGWSSGDKL